MTLITCQDISLGYSPKVLCSFNNKFNKYLPLGNKKEKKSQKKTQTQRLLHVKLYCLSFIAQIQVIGLDLWHSVSVFCYTKVAIKPRDLTIQN